MKPSPAEGNRKRLFIPRIEKPLITPYIPSTGALEWSYLSTEELYDNDSVYSSDVKYAYYKIDAWFGYSLDSKKSLYANKEIKVHRFVAIRGFKQKFMAVPALYKTASDYRFKDNTGILASLNIFRQLFIKQILCTALAVTKIYLKASVLYLPVDMS
ncbi:MAG: hypothetical protein IPI54_01690 [Chitinophagaceae bacterium]|nr:hypothetical protein [Chitinophagaceae bacterium]